jgi:putative chitinase
VEKVEIFNAIKAFRDGLSFEQSEVDALDKILDRRPGAKHELLLPETFFKFVREKLTGPLKTEQVVVINDILTMCSSLSLAHTAYVLATAWHEARFEPVPEWGRGKGKPYANIGKYGQSQYGRGLVQLTWDKNYEWADAACARAGLLKPGELLKDFNLALRHDVAVFILVQGMIEGAFCKDDRGRHTLARHISTELGTRSEFMSARRIINGTDKKEQIANHAISFGLGLQAGRWQ